MIRVMLVSVSCKNDGNGLISLIEHSFLTIFDELHPIDATIFLLNFD